MLPFGPPKSVSFLLWPYAMWFGPTLIPLALFPSLIFASFHLLFFLNPPPTTRPYLPYFFCPLPLPRPALAVGDFPTANACL
jgi:hypothetical protein